MNRNKRILLHADLTRGFRPTGVETHRYVSSGIATWLTHPLFWAILLWWASGFYALAGSPASGASAAGDPTVSDTSSEILSLNVGRSITIQSPWMVKRISISDPKIADVQVLTPEKVLVFGKSVGVTDLVLWSENEDHAWQVQIHVQVDILRLEASLKRLFPRSSLSVFPSANVYVITGVIEKAEHIDRMHRYLEAMGVNYVDMTDLAGDQQVQIDVRVVEASRAAVKAFGINALRTGQDFFGASTIGPDGGGPLNPINIGVPDTSSAGPNIPFGFIGDTSASPAATILAGFPRADLELFIQALAENQYLRILAEPTLVALSGEEASFLAGGEFPIPVVQNSSGGGSSITIEYKEFGVSLSFVPTVLGEGKIRLHIAPEVSSLSTLGSVEIEGFRIPSVLTRRAETTLVLHSGQTFAMAGLLSQDTTARASRVPLLGNLPILGSMFRSVRYENGETELLILVTASLVEPLSDASDRPLPGSAHVPPTDAEFYGQGRIEGRVPSYSRSDAGKMLSQLGLGELKGPGGWDSFGGKSFSTSMTKSAWPEHPRDDSPAWGGAGLSGR